VPEVVPAEVLDPGALEGWSEDAVDEGTTSETAEVSSGEASGCGGGEGARSVQRTRTPRGMGYTAEKNSTREAPS
jgi:hypothetical protein